MLALRYPSNRTDYSTLKQTNWPYAPARRESLSSIEGGHRSASIPALTPICRSDRRPSAADAERVNARRLRKMELAGDDPERAQPEPASVARTLERAECRPYNPHVDAGVGSLRTTLIPPLPMQLQPGSPRPEAEDLPSAPVELDVVVARPSNGPPRQERRRCEACIGRR